MKLTRVNEGTSSEIQATFRNKEGVVHVPDSAQYRVDCVESGLQIRTWTDLEGMASVLTIPLSDSDNETTVATLPVERHEVTVRAMFGANPVTASYVYEVKNLRFLA